MTKQLIPCVLHIHKISTLNLFPYKASGKAQAPIITELEEVVSDFFRKSLKLETEPVKYESLCNDIIAEMDIADEDN